MLKFIVKADYIGALTSTLCLIHCLIGPFIFMAWTSSSVQSNGAPNWWHILDYIFLVISFFAIYKTTQQTDKTWINYGFWTNWILLVALILNEKTAFVSTPETLIYIPTIIITGLHIYKLTQASSQTVAINTVTAKYE